MLSQGPVKPERTKSDIDLKGHKHKGGKGKMPHMGTKDLIFTSGTLKDNEENITCDPCGLKQKCIEAKAFCLVCKKYMCADCQHEHQTASMTSSHILLIGHEIPRNRMHQSPRKIVDQCENHAFRMAEFYCPKHTDVFCIECKEAKHVRCPNVEFVKKMAKGIKSGKEIPRTLQMFRKMVVQFERVKSIKLSQQERVEEQLADSMRAVNTLRKELNIILDNMEKNMKATIEKRFAKEISDLEEQRSSCEAKVSILEEEIFNLDILNSAEESKCFVALLKAKQRFTECESILNNLSKHKRELKYEFEPNHRLLYSLKELDTLGNIKTSLIRPQSAALSFTPAQTPSLDIPSNMMSTLKKGRDFVMCGEHKIDSPEDNRRTCSVTGSVFLPDGRLLICDGKNNCVKLFDHIIQLKSTLKMPATPYDVTGTKSREIVVTVPEKKELHFAIMDPDLRTTRVIKTELGCHGIRYHRDGLLATCYSHGMFGIVMLLDSNGIVVQRFERDIEGNAIFQGPYFLAVNPKKDRFYVTDKAANSVVGLTMGGKVLFRYRSKDLEGPGSITVDKEGSVYICGRDSRNIHVIKPDGKKIKTFQSEEGLEATSICYRAADGLFVVAYFNSDKIRSYKLI